MPTRWWRQRPSRHSGGSIAVDNVCSNGARAPAEWPRKLGSSSPAAPFAPRGGFGCAPPQGVCACVCAWPSLLCSLLLSRSQMCPLSLSLSLLCCERRAKKVAPPHVTLALPPGGDRPFASRVRVHVRALARVCYSSADAWRETVGSCRRRRWRRVAHTGGRTFRHAARGAHARGPVRPQPHEDVSFRHPLSRGD